MPKRRRLASQPDATFDKTTRRPMRVTDTVSRGRELNSQRYTGGGRPTPPSHGPALGGQGSSGGLH